MLVGVGNKGKIHFTSMDAIFKYTYQMNVTYVVNIKNHIQHILATESIPSPHSLSLKTLLVLLSLYIFSPLFFRLHCIVLGPGEALLLGSANLISFSLFYFS